MFKEMQGLMFSYEGLDQKKVVMGILGSIHTFWVMCIVFRKHEMYMDRKGGHCCQRGTLLR